MMLPFPDSGSVPGTITALLSELVEHGHTLEVHDRTETFELADVVTASGRLAVGLAAWGVEPGDHVAISMANRREWLEVWFAVARLGAVLVPINTRFTESEAGYVLRKGRVSHLIWEPGAGSLDAAALARLEVVGGLALRGRAVLGPATADGEPSVVDLYRDGVVPDREDGHSVGMIQYTSGSTAFPKGAMLRNAGLVRNGWGLAQAWQLTADDVVLVANPLFHCGGSVFSFMAAVTAGSSVVLMRRWELGAGVEAIASRGVTVAPVIDAAARDLVTFADSTGRAFPTLRLLTTAADPALFARVSDSLGCQVSNVYGLTECSPNVCVGDLRDPIEDRIAHIGRPQEGIVVDIRDPGSRTHVGTGVVGEILVRGGDSIMLGYFDDPVATAQAFTEDGFLRTGDLGRLGPDGQLDYCGRAKLMIKSGGENVSIEEVEGVLRSQPDVADAVVCPVPHERFAEVGFAFLRPVSDATLDPDEVLARCRENLAGFKVPKYAIVVDDLPRAGSGKVDRTALGARARRIVGGETPPVSAVRP
jgi:acyl-CoA synthetase (AMP-forming)/AMP-acid ligase II